MLRDLSAAGPLRLTLFDPPLDASTGADVWTGHDAAMATRVLTSAPAHTPTPVVPHQPSHHPHRRGVKVRAGYWTGS